MVKRLVLALTVLGAALAAFILAAWLFPGAPSLAAPNPEEVVDVTMTPEFPFRFGPETVTVPVGATVRWTTSGTAPHTVTSEGCMAAGYGACTFDSGVATEKHLRGGTPLTTFEHRFDQPGVYRYLCRLHGQPGGLGQAGAVVVRAEGQTPQIGTEAVEPVRANASVEALSPKDGEVIVGDKVNVELRVSGATVRPAVSGIIDPAYGHYHLLLDRDHPLQEEFPPAGPARPGLYHVASDTTTLEAVSPGEHTFVAVWGFDNHNPPQPPITAAVRFTTASEPAAPTVSLPVSGSGGRTPNYQLPQSATALTVLAGTLVIVGSALRFGLWRQSG